MIIFSPISTSSEEYSFVEELYVASFPKEERRPIECQRDNLENNPLMNGVMISTDNGKPIGFITYWNFSSFYYIEHFAIHPYYRNCGYGTESIIKFLSLLTVPAVLECEMENSSEFAKRRIGFYLRCGFSLWKNKSYIQPPYPGNDGCGIPLSLMSTDGLAEDLHYDMVVSEIYKHVYLK